MSRLLNILMGIGIGAGGAIAVTQSLDYLNNRNPKIYTNLDSQQADYLPNSSRIYLKDNQASTFSQAISKAKEIPSDSPFFQQAQADISRWSEVILDIAYGRAGEGDLSGAIAAAQLTPQDNSSTKLIARQATEAVQKWRSQAQQQNLYRDYLAQAKASIKPEQASSYKKAIGILQKINSGAEEYLEAQDLIEQWNKQIYLIADRRAEEGDLKQAAAAAALLSSNSSYYQEAEKIANKYETALMD